jgi:DNA replicative helicase MCM subunit Mcm2 (Cdc46/Mcm family)
MVSDMNDKNINHSQDERMRLLLDIVQRLFYDSEENSVKIADIIRETGIHGMEEKETEETLEQLRRYGLINRLPNGKYTLC